MTPLYRSYVLLLTRKWFAWFAFSETKQNLDAARVFSLILAKERNPISLGYYDTRFCGKKLTALAADCRHHTLVLAILSARLPEIGSLLGVCRTE